MTYIVKSRDLKWAGKILPKGAQVEPKTERDHKHIELLAKIGKVEEVQAKPVRKVATMKPPPKAPEPYVTRVVEPEPVAEPEAVEAATDDFPQPRTYHTRRLTAED